jgi:hypothetical protein
MAILAASNGRVMVMTETRKKGLAGHVHTKTAQRLDMIHCRKKRMFQGGNHESTKIII